MNKTERILIIRTDRIGDVVLSTPVLTAARSAFKDAYIAVMVSSETKEIVAKNPYINEVIVYDKKQKHKGIFHALQFIMWLKKKKFSKALILHSTKRINLVTFLAGIPERVGFARGKWDFLLTNRLEYKKRLGEKHEVEYSLDVLRALGVRAEQSPLEMTVRKSDENSIDHMLHESRLKDDDRFIVVHPGASCISKMWPKENFAKLSDILIDRFGVKIVLVTSPEQLNIGEETKSFMKDEPIFLCGKTSLGELAALLKKASLFISNDSGPVHIACAVGTPVISIFGRNDTGLSPTRWRPLNRESAVMHKDVGCKECLAHNCKKDFLCLRSVTVEDVIEKAAGLLREKEEKN
ncbi:MAG: lipopolysaccharide heptosyltransferase II [Candidatus Omnitrophota bacterium]|nr:lipopolysaccharide heptosyltransferase II [Candidatus Omnitrophota bacterium]